MSNIPPGRIRSIHAQARSNGVAQPASLAIKVVETCLVLKPAAELYGFVRRLENLTQVIKYPFEVLPLDEGECLWWFSTVINGHRIEWNTVIINEEPHELIAWQTLEGAPVPNAGTVRFEPAPDDRATEVTVQLEFDPPGGSVGKLLARLSGSAPSRQVQDALQRFKALMETGAIPGEIPRRGGH
jgi:uncharacterized membrane protein